MKQKFLRFVNLVIWFFMCVILMTSAYREWSIYGDYTIMSFICSLVFHAVPCVFIGCGIDYVIRKYIK